MIKLTALDDCPDKEPCQFEIDSDCNFIGVIRYCKLHQALADTGLKDSQVWDEMRTNAGAREKARYAAKLSLGLDRKHTGVPFKIEADGSFTLCINQKDIKMTGLPVDTSKLIADINAALVDHPAADKVRLTNG